MFNSSEKAKRGRWSCSKAPRNVIYATTDAPFSFVKLLVPSGCKICAKVTSWRALQNFRSGQEVGFGLSRSSSRDPSESKFVLMSVLSWGQIWQVWMKHYFGVAGAQFRLGNRVFQTFCKKKPCSFQIIMCLRGCIMEYPKSSLYNLPLLSFSTGFAIHPATARPLSSRKRFPSFRWGNFVFSFPQEPRFCILVVA